MYMKGRGGGDCLEEHGMGSPVDELSIPPEDITERIPVSIKPLPHTTQYTLYSTYYFIFLKLTMIKCGVIIYMCVPAVNVV